MVNKVWTLLLVAGVTLSAASWTEVTGKLSPGGRVVVEHKGKLDQGLFSLANADEIVLTTAKNGFISIPQAEVDRITKIGLETQNLTYFANARDQLRPKAEVIYERAGAPPALVKAAKKHWWSAAK